MKDPIEEMTNQVEKSKSLTILMDHYKEAYNNKAPETLKEWQAEVHSLAKEKGWYAPAKSTVETYTLIASEIFEAIEDFRSEKPAYYLENDKPCGQAVEMADAVIRIMDYCEYRGWDLQKLIEEKHKYNKTRPHRHNKKL